MTAILNGIACFIVSLVVIGEARRAYDQEPSDNTTANIATAVLVTVVIVWAIYRIGVII